MPLLRSILHNMFVVFVGFVVALLGVWLDHVFHLHTIYSRGAFSIGFSFLVIGFLLRVWATYYFYRHKLKVIVLHAQQTLITNGPFAFSRNPLYLGGNVFIFLGASLLLGTPMGIIITMLHLPLMQLMVIREEKQLEKKFGKQWIIYKRHVPRWI